MLRAFSWFAFINIVYTLADITPFRDLADMMQRDPVGN